jgi:uncharacterized SAM-binding protein YcdF (DUF218 family)
VSSPSLARNPSPPPSNRHLCFQLSGFHKRAFQLAGFSAALLLAAWLFRAPLLTGLADAWIVTDPPVEADAIVVLGGGVQTRPFEAARLYHQAYAPKILIASPKLRPTDKLGFTPPDTDVTKQILLNQGVPETAILVFGKKVTSTYDESLALRDWAKASGAKNVVVISDPFSSRRVRWLFSKYLNPKGTHVITRAAPALEYASTNWWQHEEGLIAFENEVIKYGYYRIKY